MGTNQAGDCSNTRNIDTTAAVSEWSIAPETESTNEDHDWYPGDSDMDATASEVASSLSYEIQYDQAKYWIYCWSWSSV
jgi:hypothetical protein